MTALRTAYTRHCLRAALGGYAPMSITRFARAVGFITNLE